MKNFILKHKLSKLQAQFMGSLAVILMFIVCAWIGYLAGNDYTAADAVAIFIFIITVAFCIIGTVFSRALGALAIYSIGVAVLKAVYAGYAMVAFNTVAMVVVLAVLFLAIAIAAMVFLITDYCS